MADVVATNNLEVINQLSQVLAVLDAALPQIEVGKPTSMPTLSPAQFDSLLASW